MSTNSLVGAPGGLRDVPDPDQALVTAVAERLTSLEGVSPHADRLRIAVLLERWVGLSCVCKFGFEEAGLLRSEPRWSRPGSIVVALAGEFATFDGDGLTRLVFLAHDHAVRVALIPRPPGEWAEPWIFLRLTARPREGALTRQHPTLRAALDVWWDRDR